jgi:hypothetical protein
VRAQPSCPPPSLRTPENLPLAKQDLLEELPPAEQPGFSLPVSSEAGR